ncbi:MAG: hypothetical protein ABSG74_02550 [Candidatus Bathyarchaeia archaeon]
MPYKDMESHLRKCDEACVQDWIRGLNPNSKSCAYYFLRYRTYVIEQKFWKSAQAMLNDHSKCLKSRDKKINYTHLDSVINYVAGMRTGVSDKRNTWSAIRSFYEHHRQELQPLRKTDSNKMFRRSKLDEERVYEEQALTLEEVHRLIRNAPSPYNHVFTVMLQAGMAEAEFEQFNSAAWRQIVDKLDRPEAIEIPLLRSKVSRDGRLVKFFPFIGNDGKKAIKDWLKMRPQAADPYLFVTWRKGGGKNHLTGAYVPVTGELIIKQITKIAMRIHLITKGTHGPANRYHVHEHEFRDLFRTLCDMHGVKHVGAEFMMGHSIDSYRKAHLYNIDFYRDEYKKIEPYLNVISNPPGSQNIQLFQQENRRTANRLFLLALHYSERAIKKIAKDCPSGDLANLPKEEMETLSEKARRRFGATPAKPKPQRKKFVTPAEGRRLVEDKGWNLERKDPDEWLVKEPEST